MTPRIVDGLHYHLPFYREVVDSKAAAKVVLEDMLGRLDGDVTSTSIEPMGDGWAVTINLEAQS